MKVYDTVLWTDPGGMTHRATVVDLRPGRFPGAVIEYWDNTRRGNSYRAGRRYNHGTRARVVVYQRELRPVTEGEANHETR